MDSSASKRIAAFRVALSPGVTVTNRFIYDERDFTAILPTPRDARVGGTSYMPVLLLMDEAACTLQRVEFTKEVLEVSFPRLGILESAYLRVPKGRRNIVAADSVGFRARSLFLMERNLESVGHLYAKPRGRGLDRVQ